MGERWNGQKSWKGWKIGLGKKLIRLHRWNAWVVLVLAVSGLVLAMGSIRGVLGAGRVLLKQMHIGLGLLSVALLLWYLPSICQHFQKIRKKRGQLWNLAFVLALLAGWIVSGIIMWQERRLPSRLANMAVFWHDLLTWVGIPYALFHAITRMRWVKRADRRSVNRETLAVTGRKERNANSRPDDRTYHRARDRDDVGGIIVEGHGKKERKEKVTIHPAAGGFTRRSFIKVAAGTVIVLGIGPSFYRWMKRMTDTGGAALERFAEADGNRMIPEPVPLPDSANVIGGGADGYFRVYTVTEIPSFRSSDWVFSVSGLVEAPLHLSWEQFLQIPRKVQVSDFHCVTGWSVYHCTWEGIPLADLLEKAGVAKGARYVKFYSGDGVYTDALSLKQANMDDVMVAVMLDGKPIPQKLGGPVRLIVPKMYTYKSVKWLQMIELIENAHIGFWELRGYDNDAWL